MELTVKPGTFIPTSLLLTASLTCQAIIPPPIVKPLNLQNNTMNTLCFFINTTKPASFTYCKRKINRSLRKLAINSHLIQYNFIKDAPPLLGKPNSLTRDGFQHYTLLGKVNGKYLLYALNHLGRSRLLNVVKNIEQIKGSLRLHSLAIGEDSSINMLPTKPKKKVGLSD